MINEQLGMALSLSSSGEPSCYGETELEPYYEDESDGESPIVFTTSESRCEQLYHEGLEMQCRSDLEGALSCFLRCLEGMQQCEYFAKLPQTLHQLSTVYSILNCSDKAEEFAKAEKLFYQSVTTEPKPAEAGGGARGGRTKRRPFSKKPKPATRSEVCNPADYFPTLSRRAEELDSLSRVCAKEGKYDLAKEYCSNAATIRACIFGENHYLTSVSLDLYGILCREAEVEVNANKCQLETSTSAPAAGDLPTVRSVGGLEEDRITPSAHCGGAQTDTAATSILNGHSQPLHYPANNLDLSLEVNSPGAQCAGTLYQHYSDSKTVSQTPAKDEESPSSTLSPANGERSLQSPLSQERSLPGLTPDAVPVGGEVTVTPTQEASQDCESPQTVQECSDKTIHEIADKQAETGQGSKQDLTIWGRVQGRVADTQEIRINVYTGVKNNLNKLSELKTPLCVNLDPHKGAGEDAGQTRCLPMWVLLLPAFLALIGYMFYYH